jgi:hypothetical protein
VGPRQRTQSVKKIQRKTNRILVRCGVARKMTNRKRVGPFFLVGRFSLVLSTLCPHFSPLLNLPFHKLPFLFFFFFTLTSVCSPVWFCHHSWLAWPHPTTASPATVLARTTAARPLLLPLLAHSCAPPPFPHATGDVLAPTAMVSHLVLFYFSHFRSHVQAHTADPFHTTATRRH